MLELRGEWDLESNEKMFNYRGYRCSIKKHPQLKILCGYVKLPKRVNLDDLMKDEGYIDCKLRVHGGITYTNVKDNVLGFDCAHSFDLVPTTYGFFDFDKYLTYRNSEYVRKELEGVVNQLIGKCKKHTKNK